ncbi:TolC family protein [Massilibacteroides sp.]|uniref:TolC family protein n=1 Tax=Massilibacteroides sp. TaxID=2034766 RepID=UPI0026329A92|nr:TolC family protein [Massilibacteroides sp.]MDD4516842.1 TolC family protein [Massilibacteroides sp.]
MKKTIYMLLLSSLLSPVWAQDEGQILESIKQNNTTLNALREKASADKIANKTGINPANPEVEFGYLWGSPSEIGNRKDLSIAQTFDFPTAYHYKTQLSKGQNRQVDFLFAAEERAIIQEARLICIELTYRNLFEKQLSKRLKQAEELAEGYETLFSKGEINIIDYNKTKLNLLNTRKAYEVNQVEQKALSDKLQTLNGGMPVNTELLLSYSDYLLPKDFSSWLLLAEERNPNLKATEQDIALSRKQEQLTKALNLPKLSAGYVSERVPGTTQQGVSVGVSIPLWEGKNTVRHQKARTIAMQAQYDDTRLQFQNELKSNYEKAQKLYGVLQEYDQLLKTSSNEELLEKAFKQKQLSLINYLLELSAYYDAVDQYLETEKEYQLIAAELRQWE